MIVNDVDIVFKQRVAAASNLICPKCINPINLSEICSNGEMNQCTTNCKSNRIYKLLQKQPWRRRSWRIQTCVFWLDAYTPPRKLLQPTCKFQTVVVIIITCRDVRLAYSTAHLVGRQSSKAMTFAINQYVRRLSVVLVLQSAPTENVIAMTDLPYSVQTRGSRPTTSTYEAHRLPYGDKTPPP